jgi:hypothetical protein
MKKTFYLMMTVLAAGIIMACDKDDKKPGNSSNTNPPSQSGTGIATLHYGTDSLVIQGSCGATDDLGFWTIAIQDATTSTNIFTIALNTEELPSSTTQYTITESSSTNENEVSMGFSLISNSTILDWSSDANSGTVTMVVNGDEVTCTFNNIPLQPSEVYNDGNYDQVGYVTGTMVFYR